MIIRKVGGLTTYYKAPQVIINDPRLSIDALSVLLYLLAKVDHWEANGKHLQNRFNVGKKRIQNAMRELRLAGYATLETMQSETGQLRGKGYTIREESSIPYDSAKPCENRMPTDAADDDFDGDDDDFDVTDEAQSVRSDEQVGNGKISEVPRETPTGAVGREPLSASVAVGGSHIDINKDQKITPKSPLAEAPAEEDFREGVIKVEDFTPEVRALWEKFVKLWPWGERDSQGYATKPFGGLSNSHREAAIAMLPRYLETREVRDGKRRTGTGKDYLRERKWEALPKPGEPQKFVMVLVDTPEWGEWDRIWRATPGTVGGLPRGRAIDERGRATEGWRRPRKFPDDSDYRTVGLEPPPPGSFSKKPKDDLDNVSL